jgi:hypothetical protein
MDELANKITLLRTEINLTQSQTNRPQQTIKRTIVKERD